MRRSYSVAGIAWLALTASAALACKSGGSAREIVDADEPHDPAAAGEWKQPDFCRRQAEDAIRDLFCVDSEPQIGGLMDLQRLLGLRPDPEPTPSEDPAAAIGTLFTVAVLGHSTSLSGHLVSPINPRAIVMNSSTFMAFQRGVQSVELIGRQGTRGRFNFYLLEFEQACSDSAEGCLPGDLYTEAIESGWRRIRIRDGEELKNTPQDCRVCHQRGSEQGVLLMRELERPWTHFFQPPSSALAPPVSGSDLLSDYVQAKGDEPYAGFLLHTISEMTPFFLESLVGREQPLLFDALLIEGERYPYGPDGYASEPQPSPLWEAAYEAFKRGEQLALPYLDQRASDPDKQAALTQAYVRYRQGEIGARELPDLADIFPDDPLERARRGLQTEPHATPEQTLIQACGACHNDALDQSISRARFNISVSRHDRRQLDVAIERMERARTAEGVMPPPQARQLDPAARAALIEYLRGDPSSLDRDGLLDRAAGLGMMGGGGRGRAFQ